MKKLFAALAVVAALSPFSTAQAGVIVSTNSITMSEADWEKTLSFDKFDTRLGTLTSVTFDLSGLIEGIGSAENKNPSPANVTLSLGSRLELFRPNGDSLVVTNPLFTKKLTLGAFDGVNDLQGVSAGTTGLVTAGKSDFFITNDVNDFLLFSAVGGGTIDLNLLSESTSRASGSGNLASEFSTAASANVVVTYTYTEATVEVPEPGSMATMFAGLGLIAALRRRKGKQA